MLKVVIHIKSPRPDKYDYAVAEVSDGRLRLHSLQRWGAPDEAGHIAQPALTREEFEAFVIEARKAFATCEVAMRAAEGGESA